MRLAARGLKPKPRGKQEGEGRSLAPSQEDKIRKLICDKRPEQLKMDFAVNAGVKAGHWGGVKPGQFAAWG